MEAHTLAEAQLPQPAYLAAFAPMQMLGMALAQMATPIATATQGAAAFAGVAATAAEIVRQNAPLIQSQLMARGAMPGMKTMAPGSRIMVEIRALNGTDYRLAMVRPHIPQSTAQYSTIWVQVSCKECFTWAQCDMWSMWGIQGFAARAGKCGVCHFLMSDQDNPRPDP
jgi:hypothetical protein